MAVVTYDLSGCGCCFTPGSDCTAVCTTGTTAAQYDITFAGFTNGTCTDSATVNATFRVTQTANPCIFTGNTFYICGASGARTSLVQMTISGSVVSVTIQLVAPIPNSQVITYTATIGASGVDCRFAGLVATFLSNVGPALYNNESSTTATIIRV